MIRALIVDDEPLPRERIRTLLARYEDLDIIGECRDGVEALEAIQAHRPDLVFLDIQMPGLDGFGVLNALPPTPLPAIIFVTAYDEYALDAFEVNALDYLLKPIHPARFDKALTRAIDRLEQSRRQEIQTSLHAFLKQVRTEHGYPRRFVVRTGSTMYFVRTEDIDWIEAAANYARLHMGGKVHLVRETLKSLETRLNPEVFLRIHRSLIVNIDRIATIEPYSHGAYSLTMKDGTLLTTSRTYSDRLRALFS